MSDSIETCMVSRRTALFLFGVTVFGAGVPVTLLTASDAEAQTAGMERRQERREARHERREERRAGRHGGHTEATGATGQTKPGSSGEAKSPSSGQAKTSP
jgi:hypothetical protein